MTGVEGWSPARGGTRRLGRVALMVAFLAASVWAGVTPRLAAAQAPASPARGVSVIYLVRHAERATDHPRDPTLSTSGTARARELARLLADAPLTRIFSTSYRRTVRTAGPVAEGHGLKVEFYDPRGEALQDFAALVAGTPGHHLVVGHSNTTPALVEALGGDPVSPIDEMEYDRIYMVTIAPGGSVTSTLLRFGARSATGDAS